MPLHVSSTCAHHQEVKIELHSIWYHQTYRWPSCAQVERGLVIKERPKTENTARRQKQKKKKHFFSFHTERPTALGDCRVRRNKCTSHQVAGGGTATGGYQASSQNCESYY